MAEAISMMERLARTRFEDTGFWLRRALRLDSTDQGRFKAPALDPADQERLRAIARSIRLADGPRIAVIHGVMPRSGTNYINALLRLHPDVAADPLGLKELPLLAIIPEARRWEEAFLDFYRGNAAALGDMDLFAGAVAALMRRAQLAHGDKKLLLFKVPHTRLIDYFPALFPDDWCLLLLREGRHVVNSTIKTWPLKPFGKSFADICREWTYATDAALDYWAQADRSSTWLGRYEAVLADPKGHVEALLALLGLDPARYPYDRMRELPVLGSSELSRGERGAVSWDPVKAPKDFDPAGRRIDWPQRRARIFDAIAGQAMRRAGYG